MNKRKEKKRIKSDERNWKIFERNKISESVRFGLVFRTSSSASQGALSHRSFSTKRGETSVCNAYVFLFLTLTLHCALFPLPCVITQSTLNMRCVESGVRRSVKWTKNVKKFLRKYFIAHWPYLASVTSPTNFYCSNVCYSIRKTKCHVCATKTFWHFSSLCLCSFTLHTCSCVCTMLAFTLLSLLHNKVLEKWGRKSKCKHSFLRHIPPLLLHTTTPYMTAIP